MRTWLGIAALTGLFSCGGKDDTGAEGEGEGEGGRGKATLRIESPSDGATFEEGEEVTFEVAATYENGDEADVSDVVWAAGDWGRTGASITDNSLPVGELTIEVTATVDGHELDDSVSVTVNGPEETGDSGDSEDTGDTGDGSTTYGGRFNADLTYDVYTVACPGVIHLTIDADDTITGNGECYITEIDYAVTFEVDGALSGSSLDGNLVMTGDDGSEYLTPYTGTLSGNHIDGSFNETFTSGDGSLTIEGTFSADPS